MSASRLQTTSKSNWLTDSNPALKQLTFAAKFRSRCAGMRTSSIHSNRTRYWSTRTSVWSVEPSLTITHRSGRRVCDAIESSVNRMNCSSFRAGVITTYCRARAIGERVTHGLTSTLGCVDTRCPQALTGTTDARVTKLETVSHTYVSSDSVNSANMGSDTISPAVRVETGKSLAVCPRWR